MVLIEYDESFYLFAGFMMAFATFSSEVSAQAARIAEVTELRTSLGRAIKQRDRKILEDVHRRFLAYSRFGTSG